MPIRQKGLLEYIPATIHPGKDFHVSYYVINPDTNKLERKKVRLNRIKRVSDRNSVARQLVHNINVKLAKGWNPFIENEAPKSLHKLTDVINTFQTVKFKETEANTIRSYKSFLKMLTDYITNILKEPNMFVYRFDKVMASDMMLWILANRAKTGKTFNNYLRFFKILFNWMKEFNYVRTNPFENIRPKPEKEKFRKPVDNEMRNRIREYLYENNKNYLAICLLCYHCFMRPKEICELKVCDISISKKTIRVRADIAKNDKESYRTIPDHMMKHFLDLNLSAPGNHFLFADHEEAYSFATGSKKIDSRKIAKYWEKIRKVLKLPKEIQFYSLKDSGIIQIFDDGVSLPEIQAQADHSSDRITRIYYRHKRKTASPEILDKASKF